MHENLRQYDLCRMDDGRIVVIIQNDLFADMRSRLVIPLAPRHETGAPIRWLNPLMMVGDQTMLLLPQYMAAVPVATIAGIIGNVSGQRDAITRAVDTLLAGV